MTSIVVADAGPLHYLVLVDCADILEKLFDQVLVPYAVRDELLQLNTPETVKTWLRRPPPWLKVERVECPTHPRLASRRSGGVATRVKGQSLGRFDGRPGWAQSGPATGPVSHRHHWPAGACR